MSKTPLVLILLTLACDSETTVQVSGAVRNPGNVVIQEAATLDDILTFAGGLTGEGNRDRVQVLRTVTSDTVVRIPADQVVKWQTDDRIHVPYKAPPGGQMHIVNAAGDTLLPESSWSTALSLGSPGTARVDLSGPDEPFDIDTTEVTVSQFRVWDEVYDPDYADGNMPANGIPFEKAKAYCESCLMRLPTLSEWRHACTGKRQLLYSNSVEYDKAAARVGLRTWGDGPKTVASYPLNDLGLYDMVGNVWEWVVDKNGQGFLVGGSWVDGESRAGCSRRLRVSEATTAANYGFRCAR